MTNKPTNPSQLLPTVAIQNALQVSSDNWFEYPVTAHPHHTDYGGVVWHGSYVAWMEEARVECLRSIGVDYAKLVALGCELRVVELYIRYRQPVLMGMTAIVKTRIAKIAGVRIPVDYEIRSPDGQDLFVTAHVTLVPVEQERGKILRQLPPGLKDALLKLTASH